MNYHYTESVLIWCFTTPSYISLLIPSNTPQLFAQLVWIQEKLTEMLKLTEQIQHLPGEQAHQLLLQHLLRHLAILTHHLLLILPTIDKQVTS